MTKDTRGFGDVIRRALVGELLLDVSTSVIADPDAGLQPGDRIAIASQVDNAGKRLLVAFTDNERLRAVTEGRPVSLGQPAVAVLEQAVRDYDGIVIDPRHPGMFIAYADELRRAMGDDPTRSAQLATALLERDQPFLDFLAGLATSTVYVAASVQRAPDGTVTGATYPGVRDAEGRPYGVICTSPAEVWAWGEGLEARATRAANVAQIAIDDGHVGIMINPRGPSMTLDRAQIDFLAAGERA
jgi:hypothetical protein